MKNRDEEQPKKSGPEIIKLKHTKTRGQRIDKEGMEDMLKIKKDYDQQVIGDEQKLESFDRVLLSSFQKDRMTLERLLIITNQSRAVMGQETYTKKRIKDHLDKLVDLEYLEHQEVTYENQTNDVYILTEKGKEESF